jgi:predicted nucleic acid-binding Zn ribbon protein
MANKKKELSKRERRNLRVQQVVFILIGLILILSMVISLVAIR